MKITNSDIRRLVSSTIYARGKNYYKNGRVRLIEIEENYFCAEVLGTYEYKVEVHYEYGDFGVSCNCPYWDICKHIVAAMLEAKNFYEQNRNAFRQGKLVDWRRYFEDAIVSSSFEYERKVSNWQLVYLLDFQKRHWTLYPQKAYVKKDGTFGRLNKLNLWELTRGEINCSSADALAITHLEKLRVGSGAYFYYEDHLSVPTNIEYGAKVGTLLSLLRDSQLFLARNQNLGKRLHFNPDPIRIELRVEEGEDGIQIVPFMLIDEHWEAVDQQIKVLSSEPIWLLSHGNLIEATGLRNAQYLIPFINETRQKIFIPKEDVPQFFNDVLPRLDIGDALVLSSELVYKTVTKISKKRIYLEESIEDLLIRLKFAYEGVEVTWPSPTNSLFAVNPQDGHYMKIERDREEESKAVDLLITSDAKLHSDGFFGVKKTKVLDWLIDGVAVLLEHGFEIFGEERLKLPKVRRGNPRVNVAVASGIDWFDLDLAIEIDGAALAISEIRRALYQKERYVKLADGSIARLPEKWLSRFRYLLKVAEGKEDNLRLSKYHATLIDELFDDAERKRYDKTFKEQLKRLKNFNRIEEVVVPESFNGTLRIYQKAGYDWLHFLKEMGFGGCLADDMGLGKTIQALALLLHEHENGAPAPSLIIAPVSVIFNWVRETERFAPKLRVLNHTGIDREKITENFNDYDIVLTSYGTGLRDIEHLKDYQFHYVILDESQKIKNPESQTAKAVRLLKANHRLVLTGTPVENSTIELWSQFAFLNPGFLGNLNYFKEEFAKPIERERDRDIAEMLRRITFPFILRRTKDKVAKELPPKVENTVHCEMTPPQRKLYDEWRDSYRAAILSQIDSIGLEKSRMHVLAGLTMLRQIACHPQTVKSTSRDQGGKFEAFFEMIEEILAEGHKILVFSQFVKILTFMRQKLDAYDTHYAYLDGRTRDREKPVKMFQENEECRLFLISLRAGGTGLNLTAADYVIHYDPWWNPAVEVQATDRTHRIGQDKHVFVYKLITRDSIEEKILELQEKKKELVSNLITTDAGFFKKLTKDDIVGLFS